MTNYRPNSFFSSSFSLFIVRVIIITILKLKKIKIKIKPEVVCQYFPEVTVVSLTIYRGRPKRRISGNPQSLNQARPRDFRGKNSFDKTVGVLHVKM